MNAVHPEDGKRDTSFGRVHTLSSRTRAGRFRWQDSRKRRISRNQTDSRSALECNWHGYCNAAAWKPGAQMKESKMVGSAGD